MVFNTMSIVHTPMQFAMGPSRFFSLFTEMDTGGSFDFHTWDSYFSEVVRIFEGVDRLYGIASICYTQYVLERLEY